MSSILESKVAEHFKKKGWSVQQEEKIRGLRPDLILKKDKKISLIKIKDTRGSIEGGITHALRLKNAANFSYLALPKSAIQDKTISTCEGLGIGLLSIAEKVSEAVKPEETSALKSIAKRVFKKTEKTSNSKPKTPLENLFKSNAVIQILKQLFLNSTKEFHINAMARIIDSSASTTHIELNNLYSIGLVTRVKKANMVFYKINKESIIYNEIRTIFLKYVLFQEFIKVELEKHDVDYALIFGSFANGKESESSDIDLLLVGDIPIPKIQEMVLHLEDTTKREVNLILWPYKEFEQKRKKRISLLNNIIKNPILMVKGDEKEFRRLVR